MLERIHRMPVPLLPTLVGAITLSNVLSGLGFTFARHFMMILATVLWLTYIIKILKYPEQIKKEYSQMVPCSLYAAFCMIMMLLGSYYVDYNYGLGKGLWLVGLGLHAIHILVFTYRFIIKDRKWENTLPSWFVTYNGILVAAVIGAKMNEPIICQALAYFGTFTYLSICPFQIYRIIKKGVPLGAFHTQAILLAPCSLAFVALTNSGANVPLGLLYFLYVCIFLTLCFIIYKAADFFMIPWSPAYAGLTFPMAIGIVASGNMVKLLTELGFDKWASLVGQLQWIQIFYTIVFVGYVMINFRAMALRNKAKMIEKYEGLA